MGTAEFSPCGLYRYRLTRDLPMMLAERDRCTALFVMLNPSTADATTDDRTVGRCTSFARRIGCTRLVVCNLYAYRATRPADMRLAEQIGGVDIVGPENDEWIRREAFKAAVVVAAWGANAEPGRATDVLGLLRRHGQFPRKVHALGVTADGQPCHPLYLRGDTPLVELR